MRISVLAGGAHIDEGQFELLEMLSEADSIATKYVPTFGQFKANRIGADMTRAGAQQKKMGKMLVSYDLQGITKVTVDGQDLFGQHRYVEQTFVENDSATLRIGELLLQCDWGDNHNAYFLGDIVTLGQWHYQVYDCGDHLWWRGRHEGMDPNVKKLQWTVRVSASEDGERLEFKVEVDWNTCSKRLRAAVPVKDWRMDSVWEIPYGFIRRAFDPSDLEPFAEETLAWRSIGEFPALHWVRHDIDDRRGVAILNRGIPSAKWIPGCFELSLLRSPQMTGDTVLPSVDEIWDVDDTRDTGRHTLEFAIWPYANGLSCGDLTRAGYAYNGASPETPFGVAGDVVVTAFKLAEDGDGYILRVQEANGTDGELQLQFDEPRSVVPVNLMERAMSAPRSEAAHRFPLHKHQILTLKIQ